jgi:hypothetical protein
MPSDLQTVENAFGRFVCAIECRLSDSRIKGYGTGLLVWNNLVLTAEHVIAQIRNDVNGPTPWNSIQCTFDYVVNDRQNLKPAGLTSNVVAHSFLYEPEGDDYRYPGLEIEDNIGIDYILVQINRDISAEIVAGTPRGFDLPRRCHPAAIRASAGFTPFGAVGATGDRRSWSGLRSRSSVAENVAAYAAGVR